MESYKAISMLLIGLGAIIMMLSVYKYYSTIRLVQSFLEITKKHSTRWYTIHHLLMVFFLFGYIVVLVALYNNISLISELFTSVIFLFGAAFVLIGILLQSTMLKSIQRQHTKLEEKNQQLREIEDATIYTLAHLAEIRDFETGKHIERTSQYVRVLTENLQYNPNYKDYLTFHYIDDIIKAAPLHDIGKVGVKDSILTKPGKLTDEEYEEMKKHCQLGADILFIAENKIHFHSYFPLARQLVMSHHERWDGTGYPEQLQGDEIPLSAQIMAVADVYDALTSERCYKEAFTHEVACKIIEEERGKQFAPDVVDAFMETQDLFPLIAATALD